MDTIDEIDEYIDLDLIEDTEKQSIEEEKKPVVIETNSFKENNVRNTENFDILLTTTLELCKDSYNKSIGDIPNYFYYPEFEVPFLFFLDKKTLYIAFRGTDSVENILTDLTTGGVNTDINAVEPEDESNFLNDYIPYKDILPHRMGQIEFHLGIILTLKQSILFIMEKIKNFNNTIDNIIVTGHSLGGAVAQLFTYVYNNSNMDMLSKTPITHLFTYGQPRILFNKPEYIELFDNSVYHYHRIWNNLDPIVYVPFKKNIAIDSVFNANVAGGYTHVGKSFNVSGNIVNSNINLILYEIVKGNKEKIKLLLDSKDFNTNNKLLTFLISTEFQELLLDSFYDSLMTCSVKEDISHDQLTLLTLKLQKEFEKISDYNEKTDLLKPYGITETLSKNKIGDDVEDENFCLSCVSGCVISSNKTCKLAHKLEYYDGLIYELIKRQVDNEKPIFEVIDKIDFIEKKNSEDLFKDVEGMIRGDFKEGEFIKF
jgi:hypothetical protein